MSVRLLMVCLPVALLGACGGGDKPVSARTQHLGTVDFPVSCSPRAQAEFDDAVALLHNMTYPQARQSFQQVAVTDPHCAMAYWGVAMTLFQPLWPTRPDSAARVRGWEAVTRAWALVPPTKRESLYVATTEAFFRDPASPDYWQRVNHWEAATGTLHAALPDDAEATVFYALALLASSNSSTASEAHASQAADLLLGVYREHPGHPGAMHYLIHANDAPGRESQSLDITNRYAEEAPQNAHALHMPTHIYTRLGDWNDVIRGNLLAADAALKVPAGDHGEFVWDEFPHAIEYLVYAYLQQGRDDSAAVQLKRLQETPRLQPTFKTAFHLSSTQARYALERRDWEAASRIVPREPASLDWDHFAWPEGIAQFARGLGAAHLGRPGEAKGAATRLGQLDSAMTRAGEDLFARNIRMLQLELSAWIAQEEGKAARATSLMQQAVELEAATPKHAVTPAPTLPASELLGDLYMAQKQPRLALAAYQHSLELYPRRFNSTLGTASAAAALGDDTTAQKYYAQLLDIAGTGLRPVMSSRP